MKAISATVSAFAVAALGAQITTVTYTTYLPFEQHPCANFYAIDQVLPEQACEAGACCVQIVGIGKPTGVVPPPPPPPPDSTDGDGSSQVACTQTPCTEKPIVSPPPMVTSKTGSEEPGTTTEVESIISSEKVITTTATSDEVKVITTTEIETPDKGDPTPVTTDAVETITTEEPMTETVTTTIEDIVTTEVITTEEPVTETITTTIDGTATTETFTTEEPVTETVTSKTVATVITETITTEEPVTETVTTPEVETSTPEDSGTTEVITETETITSGEVITTTERIPIPPTPSPRPPMTTTSDDPTCPTPTCSIGIDRAVYPNPFTNDVSATYESFDPDHFKTAKPKQVDVVDEIFISTPRGDVTYEDAGAEYRAFLFACQDGTYNFTSPYSDDITILWFGEKAYKGWTRDNADIIQFYYGNNKPQTIQREIKAGTYYPIRVMWGNTGGAADLKLQIYAPDGRQLLGTDGSSYLTTDACDGSYPPYEEFGSET